MPAKTPLAVVKDTFGDKTKLVEALEKLTADTLWVSRTNKDKGLGRVSNAKLLKLHATFSAVKDKFGTREKLIDAILELENRAKDAGYRQRLNEWPVPRLYDTYRSLEKRSKAAAKAKAKAKAPSAAPAPPAGKSAAATQAAAKKTATKAKAPASRSKKA